MRDTLVESELRTAFGTRWGILWIVAAWICLSPLVMWALAHHLHVEFAFEHSLLLSSLVAGTGIYCTLYAIRATYFAITRGRLQIGRSPRETIVEFADIESIVVGLPAQQSRLMRSARHVHSTAIAYQDMVDRRQGTVLIRLKGERHLALYVSPRLVANAVTLVSTFLQLNADKIVGPQSYTREEIKRLVNVRFNTVVNA
jgi:hypothetical protein